MFGNTSTLSMQDNQPSGMGDLTSALIISV